MATAQSSDPSFWLGAALPDLQREAGVAVGDDWPVSVLAGVASHRAADAVFHDLPVFRDQSGALTRSLLTAGVPRGAARAIGHAGWELLLDGTLIDDEAVTGAYAAAMAEPASDPAWQHALRRRIERGVPRFYGDPARVAELLLRVLSTRRLLAFGREHLESVTNALAEAQPAIAVAAPSVFAALSE
ncbi:MAG: hypothetical protein QOJ00_2327 [Actinomycetota bacterium]